MTKIGFIGGTGPEGLGLAMRFAKTGDEVFLGSRSLERAQEAAARVQEKAPQAPVRGMLNAEAVESCEVVFLTVPFSGHRDILLELEAAIGDRVLVDVVAPLEFGEDGPRAIRVEEGSAAQQARALVPRAKVVSGFHHLDASHLQRLEKPMQGDVVVCADHKGAKKTVMELAEKIEYVRAVDGGGLSNARYLEDWTAMLITINRIHKAHTGIRIVGI